MAALPQWPLRRLASGELWADNQELQQHEGDPSRPKNVRHLLPAKRLASGLRRATVMQLATYELPNNRYAPC